MMDGQISGEPAERGRVEATRDGATGDEDGPSRRRPAERVKAWLARAKSVLKGFKSGDGAQDLSEILNGSQGGPAGDREERALLLNVVALKTLRVDDVMVPRADIVAVELGATLDETLEAFRAGQHSRLPVYRDTLDDPVGVIHLKDLALAYGFGARANDFALANHLRSVLVVPPSMRVQALLERMQATRRHMALVIDEYGGVDGLVTIEDILEQIVGAIDDEHDDADRPMWVRQADDAYLADARALVSDFQEALGVTLLIEDWNEEIDTLGGLVFMLCGRVPARGEVVAHPAGVEFEVIDADPRRIKRLRVRRTTPTEPASGAEAGGVAGGAVAAAAATPGEAAPDPSGNEDDPSSRDDDGRPSGSGDADPASDAEADRSDSDPEKDAAEAGDLAELSTPPARDDDARMWSRAPEPASEPDSADGAGRGELERDDPERRDLDRGDSERRDAGPDDAEAAAGAPTPDAAGPSDSDGGATSPDRGEDGFQKRAAMGAAPLSAAAAPAK